MQISRRIALGLALVFASTLVPGEATYAEKQLRMATATWCWSIPIRRG
jgi:hypothetical protein